MCRMVRWPNHEGTFAIKPGDPAASQVWKRITSDDPDEVMPPPASHKQLTAEEKATIRRWIEQGAPYQKHWAFEPPTQGHEPTVRRHDLASQCRRSLYSRAARSGRPESAARSRSGNAYPPRRPSRLPACRRRLRKSTTSWPTRRPTRMRKWSTATLRRRVTARRWPGTGSTWPVMPTRTACTWTTSGQMWAYRDWVIKAFNDNLPFDDFTVWQLAGDLLPNPTPEQLTATGFNRCNVTTSEGGAIAEEFLYRYAVERASTTIQTWMGLTGGCAVCHDHKYDPLTNNEFYSLLCLLQQRGRSRHGQEHQQYRSVLQASQAGPARSARCCGETRGPRPSTARRRGRRCRVPGAGR